MTGQLTSYLSIHQAPTSIPRSVMSSKYYIPVPYYSPLPARMPHYVLYRNFLEELLDWINRALSWESFEVESQFITCQLCDFGQTEYQFPYLWASLVTQMVKNLLAMQETWVWSLRQKDPLEKGMATHSSLLSWKIPGGAWRATVHGVAKSWTRLSNTQFSLSVKCKQWPSSTRLVLRRNDRVYLT